MQDSSAYHALCPIIDVADRFVNKDHMRVPTWKTSRTRTTRVMMAVSSGMKYVATRMLMVVNTKTARVLACTSGSRSSGHAPTVRARNASGMSNHRAYSSLQSAYARQTSTPSPNMYCRIIDPVENGMRDVQSGSELTFKSTSTLNSVA